MENSAQKYKGRTQIFYAMLELLSDYKTHHAQEICEKLEIGLRSVSRYIDAIEECGYEIEHILGRGGGIRLIENNAAKFSVLTNAQKSKLIDVLTKDNSAESKELLTILNLI